MMDKRPNRKAKSRDRSQRSFRRVMRNGAHLMRIRSAYACIYCVLIFNVRLEDRVGLGELTLEGSSRHGKADIFGSKAAKWSHLLRRATKQWGSVNDSLGRTC